LVNESKIKLPSTNISAAVASDLTNAMTDYSVASKQTDGETGHKIEYTNTDFEQNLGYYKSIPELRGVIDAKATWTVGKGFEADEDSTLVLDTIKGFGKDTFNTILENLIRTMTISGDAFAEIIRNEELELINFKPLDPSKIKIIADKKGIIQGYEQIGKGKNRELDINKIFHLTRNRVADEIHGVSLVEALVKIILMKNEAMDDYKRVLHRNIDPMMIFHLDTDDDTKIAAFKSKVDAARGKGENMYIPKDAVVPEMLSLAPNSTLNPLAWIQYLDNMFYEVAGVPKIILGGSGEFTEASAKIAYLAFQQTIEEDQLFIEEQVGMQLGIELKLTFPASLENEMLSDNAKDSESGAAQPNETTAGVGQ